jgi:glycosyltransferase involved in cell wall biosynthesis
VKVLVTATSLEVSYGGPAFSVSRLALALAEAGAEVALWAADGSAKTSPLVQDGAGVSRCQGSLRRLVEAFRPDVIHDNGLWLAHNHRSADLAQRFGVPRVVSTRGMLEPWALAHRRWKKRAAWLIYQKRDLDRAAALHATGAAEAENLKSLGLRPSIVAIPNGMDLPERPSQATDGTAVRTALFLGRIHPVKGLPMLMEAWGQVRPKGWRLVVAGPDEGGHLREVEAAVADAGIGEAVSFTGEVTGEAKAALLQEADLFVLPSHTESFGMAVAEALAHGTPALVSTAAPWPMLEQRGCGWLAAPRAPSLAEALARAVATEPDVLRRMGEAGREMIAAEFSWAQVAARFLDLYGGLVEQARSASPRGAR